MENFFEREVKRLAFVEERMKIREQEKKQLDAEESKRQQVSEKTYVQNYFKSKSTIKSIFCKGIKTPKK